MWWGLSWCETGSRLVSRFSSTVRVSFGRNDRTGGRREQPRGLSTPVLVAAGRQCDAPCRAHVDDVIFMALCVPPHLIINGRRPLSEYRSSLLAFTESFTKRQFRTCVCERAFTFAASFQVPRLLTSLAANVVAE